jgi:hypothetical protein
LNPLRGPWVALSTRPAGYSRRKRKVKPVALRRMHRLQCEVDAHRREAPTAWRMRAHHIRRLGAVYLQALSLTVMRLLPSTPNAIALPTPLLRTIFGLVAR